MMTRAHKLLTGGLWLLLATGCGGDTPDQPPGWAVEERADQSIPDQPAADMGEELGEVDQGTQCEAPCAPVGCGQEIRCGAPEPGLTPCPAPEWGALETPRYRCGCEPARCLDTSVCAADELCLRASPSGMSPILGACIQTTCDALIARYDAITEYGTCRQDSDCYGGKRGRGWQTVHPNLSGQWSLGGGGRGCCGLCKCCVPPPAHPPRLLDHRL
jgi:hypothetical protein